MQEVTQLVKGRGGPPPNLGDSGHFYCGVRSQRTRVKSQLWPLTGHVTLGLLPDLPGPPFPHCKMEVR